MRAIVSALFVLIMLPGIAQAQPGQPPPAGPPPAGASPAEQPYPPPPPYDGAPPAEQPYPPQPYPPQPYPAQYPPPYGPPVQLTPEEQKLLSEGEISLGQHAGGVAANWFFGFGIGQAIQGRWSDTGWMFALGEAAGITVAIVGVTQLCFDCEGEDVSNDGAGTMIAVGLIGYMVTHVWSIVDAAIGPANHNGKVRTLKRRLGIPLEARRIIPYATPVRDGGGTAGLSFRF